VVWVIVAATWSENSLDSPLLQHRPTSDLGLHCCGNSRQTYRRARKVSIAHARAWRKRKMAIKFVTLTVTNLCRAGSFKSIGRLQRSVILVTVSTGQMGGRWHRAFSIEKVNDNCHRRNFSFKIGSETLKRRICLVLGCDTNWSLCCFFPNMLVQTLDKCNMPGNTIYKGL
jgi:hypothetical protein